MAGDPCFADSHHAETAAGDYDRAWPGSGGTRSDLLQTLELPGKCHSRLVDPAQSGHESWLRQRARGQLRTGETPTCGARATAASRTLSPDLSSAPERPAGARSGATRASPCL